MHSTSQFSVLSVAGVAQANRFAAIALENAEKFAKLNLDAAKQALAQSVEGASAVVAAKDVQELYALPARYAETGVETVVGYSRSLYELSSEAQAQYSALAEEALADNTKGLASWVAQAGASAPPGSETAINAMASAVAAATAAFDQLRRANLQVRGLVTDGHGRDEANDDTKAKTPRKGRRAS